MPPNGSTRRCHKNELRHHIEVEDVFEVVVALKCVVGGEVVVVVALECVVGGEVVVAIEGVVVFGLRVVFGIGGFIVVEVTRCAKLK